MFISARRGLWVRPVRMLPAKGAGACRWHHYTCFARECKARGNPCRMEVHQKCRRADECVPAGPGRRGVPQTDRRAFRPAPPDIIRREPTNTWRIPRGGPEGPQPLRSGRGVEGGRSPPLTGEMRRRGAKLPFDCNRIPGLCPGGGSFSARRRRSPRPNSKKWPAGHFFDTRVSAACMLRRTRRCSSACRRSATAAAASRPSRQSPCPASRTKGSSAWTTPSSTE